MPTVLLGMAGGDPLEPDPEPKPPDGQLAKPIEGVRGGEGHAVIGPDRLGQAEVLKRALKHDCASQARRYRLAKKVIVRPHSTLFVDNVPPGTYYVRVRAANVTGSGPPSDEIALTVP